METELITAYIGLGSNLGDRSGNLLLAVRSLMEASFHVNRLSAIYETEPVDIESNGDFLNMVAEPWRWRRVRWLYCRRVLCVLRVLLETVLDA